MSLDPGSGIEGPTCTWIGNQNISVENIPPLSARLTTHFRRSSTAGVSYRLSHPMYLFGRDTYSQTCRYCPQIKDEYEEGYYSTEDYYKEICEDDTAERGVRG